MSAHSNLKALWGIPHESTRRMKHIQTYNRPEKESIAWWSLWFHWVYMVDSTATVNRLGEALSSVFGIPIDAGSFPRVDVSGAEITVPRRNDDGRSSAVGTSLGCPMDFSALIVYTQREPLIVASSKVFGTTCVSSPTEYI